jgi:hypothetical protein
VWFIGFGEYDDTVRVRWWVESYAEKRRSMDAVDNAIVDVAKREGIRMPDPSVMLDGKLVLEHPGEVADANAADAKGADA